VAWPDPFSVLSLLFPPPFFFFFFFFSLFSSPGWRKKGEKVAGPCPAFPLPFFFPLFFFPSFFFFPCGERWNGSGQGTARRKEPFPFSPPLFPFSFPFFFLFFFQGREGLREGAAATPVPFQSFFFFFPPPLTSSFFFFFSL